MTSLKISNRPKVDDDFYIAFQYDSRNYGYPFPFDGFQLFINNDQSPFIVLTINEKKVWNEKVDLTKLLPPGTYKLRLRTFIWTGIGNNTSATTVIKVGSFIDARSYPGVNPPPRPPNPFPEWDEYEKYLIESRTANLTGEFWDEWTVDYGV